MSQTEQSKSSDFPDNKYPLAAWFLGPRAENADLWEELLHHIFQDYLHWRKNYFPTDPIVVTRVEKRSDYHEQWIDSLTSELDGELNKLKQHFPFHSPRYIAHMLSEQTLPAVLGYFAGMLYNPNNVTAEAAPITVELELEVGRMVAEMLGYNPRRAWAHLTSGGTIANLEALWVARFVQFMPFVLREYCLSSKIKFMVKTANLSEVDLRDIDDRSLISLRPNESIFMQRRLAKEIFLQTKRPVPEILDELNTHYSNSKFNVSKKGYYSIQKELGLTPVIFVSASAHYSIAKSANILGYGEDSIRAIQVNDRFQMDTDILLKSINSMKEDEYIAAVIGIVGTTEEGAVDPIHKIYWTKKELERSKNKSFWFHIDAAWGGYIRSLFRKVEVKEIPRTEAEDIDKEKLRLDMICDEYIRALKINEKISIDVGNKQKSEKSIDIMWSSKGVYLSYLAMPDADSITVDPHKMGYIPYPAGIISFRNGLITELILQRAQYISDDSGGIKGIDQPISIDKVGPYIIEGSKPGAAALSCWLAHKTIPLETHGHGKIIRTTLLNSQKLFRYMVNHRHMFVKIHRECVGGDEIIHPFTFFPFSEPDTNIICFIIRPMMFSIDGKLELINFPLDWINLFNERIYAKASISDVRSDTSDSISQPFYVSRTRFEAKQYSYNSMLPIFKKMGITCSKEEYQVSGVFVLRSTVMNPWYYASEKKGKNYLFDFICFLHKIAAEEIGKLVIEKKRPK